MMERQKHSLMTDAATALERRRENGGIAKAPDIITDIKRMQKEFQVAMPRGAEADQLVRDAITAVRTVRDLKLCDSASVLGGLMTCAQLGLRIGVLGQAWLIPFKEWDPRSKTSSYKAQLIIGYQGYIELAHRSDKVQSLMPRTVHENDLFDIDYGVNGTLSHKPARGPRGGAIGYHAISRYTNGGYDFFYMSQEEMEEHRDKFAMAKKKEYAGGQPTGNLVIVGPWRDHFEQMALKTVIRLGVKYMPKSPELYVARFVDGGIRINASPDVSPEDATEQPLFEDAVDGELVDEIPVRERSAKQQTAINTIATQLGMTRDEKIAYVSQIIGRQINSTSDLTFDEAHQTIDRMQRFADDQAGPK